MDERLVAIGALSVATAEKLASGIRSRSKNVLFATVIVPVPASMLKFLLLSPINEYVRLPKMPVEQIHWTET